MSPHQEPLQISKPMWIVIAVVMGFGLLGKLDEPDPNEVSNERRRGPFISEDLTVTRQANETVEFPELGLVVTPMDDWSCLTVTNKKTPFRHTFVNEKARLIARLTRFPFTNWPPDLRSKSNDPRAQSDEIDKTIQEPSPRENSTATEADAISVESGRYQHVSIEWITLPNAPTMGSQKLLGRIQTGSDEALLTVIDMLHESGRDREVESFCNHIELMGQR